MREQMCSVVRLSAGVKVQAIPPSLLIKSVVSSDALPYRRSTEIYFEGMTHADRDVVKDQYDEGFTVSRFPSSLWKMFVDKIAVKEKRSVLCFCYTSKSRKSASASLFLQTRDCYPNTEKSDRRGLRFNSSFNVTSPVTLCDGD